MAVAISCWRRISDDWVFVFMLFGANAGYARCSLVAIRVYVI